MRRLSAKLLKLCIYILILSFAFGLIFFSRETSKSANDALILCATTLIPSLFPFFVISSLAVSTNMAYYMGRALERPMRAVFKLPGACAGALVMGLVGGYPLGAKTATLLYEKKLCTKSEAETALSFCCNCGPAFIFGVAGTAIFNSPIIGVLLFVCHVVSAILVGIIFSRHKNDNVLNIISRNGTTSMPFGKAFGAAVSQSAVSMLNVCAFVIFFAVTINLCKMVLRISEPFSNIFYGMLEMTNGIAAIPAMKYSLNIKIALASFFITFGGASVHCQNLSFITECGLSSKKYFLGKSLQGIFAAALALAFCSFGNFSL